MEHLIFLLKDSDRDLLREIEEERMAELDEDELLALHKRVRRARNKHSKNYRRRAAERVAELGGRGHARPGNRKAAGRAEAFEEALSIVSARLATVSHEAAEELKRERLAQARAGKSSGPDLGPFEGDQVGPGVAREHEIRPGDLKRHASFQAQGARTQAKRDARC